MAVEAQRRPLKREKVDKIRGIRATTVGRITRGAADAGGILVSPQAHGPRKQSPSKIALGGPMPSARAKKGPVYIHSLRYALRGNDAPGRRSKQQRAREHIGGPAKVSDYGAFGAAFASS